MNTPRIYKSESRERRRRKVRKNAVMGVRTSMLRAGLGLIVREVRRKTKRGKRNAPLA
jgi:hypothetical protein